MPSRHDIVTFHDPPTPPGESPYTEGYSPEHGIQMVPADPAWPQAFEAVAGQIRGALGWRAIRIEHVGSTSVPDLAAKPVIDVDLIVADPDDEAAYVPPLEAAGFRHVIREPWWFGHRVLRGSDPKANVHVFGFDSPEPIKHTILRDWLRGDAADRELYAQAKQEAAGAANDAGEHVMEYNARKERVIREIYGRAFRAAGLSD